MRLQVTVLIGAMALSSMSALSDETCVEVEIGGVKTPNYNCINARLQKQAESSQKAQIRAPFDASSPSVSTGGYNEAATRERLGPNYGISGQTYRPPASAYPSLLR